MPRQIPKRITNEFTATWINIFFTWILFFFLSQPGGFQLFYSFNDFKISRI